MINRFALSELDAYLEDFPILVLLGPRQVGKTTLAKSLKKGECHYMDLEDPDDLFALSQNPKAFLSGLVGKTVILDEVQTFPPIFKILRSMVDAHRVAGRFVLLGSADPSLVVGVSESLAGRILTTEIVQITLKEALAHNISMEEHWFKGGFPEPLLFTSSKKWTLWTENFIQTYVFRDLNSFFGINLNPQTIQRLWNMLAHLNSEVENKEKLGRSLGLTGTTVKKYIDFMVGAYLIRRLPPWYTNKGKRLVKSPKIYLRTSGILHYLLRLKDYEDLQKHPAVGASWEGYVVEQIISHLPEKYEAFYYRTQNGAELDLVLVEGIKPVMGIEIKFTNTPSLSRGFYTSIDDLGVEKAMVITPSIPHEIDLTKKVKICSLHTFLEKYLI